MQSQLMKSSRRVGVVICLLACTRGTSANADNQPSATPPPAAADTARSASTASTASPSKLAGTHWRLLEIQSMDDKQGVTRPDDKTKYTIAFDSGLVSMRLDCNRGAGKYDEKVAATGDGGSVTIGPLAMTRAFCPPPSLGDRIARDMAHVRSYRLVNGRLALSLMADGGVYIWEPDPTAW